MMKLMQEEYITNLSGNDHDDEVNIENGVGNVGEGVVAIEGGKI